MTKDQDLTRLSKLFMKMLEHQERLTAIRLDLPVEDLRALSTMAGQAVSVPHNPKLTHAVHDLHSYLADAVADQEQVISTSVISAAVHRPPSGDAQF